MAVLCALALLGCYAAFLGGLRMARVLPGHLLDDADLGASPPWRRSVVVMLHQRLGRWAGPAVADLLGLRWRAWVRRQLAAGGQPGGYDVAGFAEFQGAYVSLGVLAGGSLLLSGRPVIGALIGVAMLVYPGVWLWGEARRRQQVIERDLPDFLDVLAVTVSAGLSFRQALDRVGETLSGPLAEEMRRTLRRIDVGVRRRQAFTELRDRNPGSTTMGLFVTAILQAEELGAPLATTLNQLSRDMRREFSQQARRRAARAAPRVSLIITMVIMPGMILVIMVGIFMGSGLELPGR